MNLATLLAAFPGLPSARGSALLAGCNQALVLIGADGVGREKRASMFLAQVGAESVNLTYTEEIADGTAYNGRADLGNTQPGDGPRFKGRGFIQLTGRTNYISFSAWAHSRGLVPTVTYFVDHPEAVANEPWAWISATWYWLVARAALNTYADQGDVRNCTLLINGGLNGYDGRLARYQHNLTLGAHVLGTAGTTIALEEDMKFIVTTHPTTHAQRGFTVGSNGMVEFPVADVEAAAAFVGEAVVQRSVVALTPAVRNVLTLANRPAATP